MAPLSPSLRPLAVGIARVLVGPVAAASRWAGRLAGTRSAALPERPARILVVAIGYLGDTLLGLPLLDALASRWPQASIDVWCRHRLAELFEGRSDVRTVLASDDVPSDRHRDSSTPLGRRRDLMDSLRTRRYDLILDTCGVPGTTLAVWRAGARFTVGLSDQGLERCYDASVPYELPGEHLYDRRRRLGAALGLDLPPVGGVRVRLGWDPLPAAPEGWGGSVALLHVGAGWPDKAWSPGRWGDLARLVRERTALSPVLHHGPGERQAARAAAEACGEPAPVIVEGSTLATLVARVAASRVVVAADSGPGHLAAALGVPVVSLFGPTRPESCRPLSDATACVVAADGRMESITAGDALAAMLRVQGGSG